jgi:recombination protein RecA
MATKTEAKWSPKISKFMKAVEARTTIPLDHVVVKPSFKMECVSSGSTVVNLLIGGSRLADGSFVCPGWARGTINEIYGRESSGKTTLALSAMAQVLMSGGTAVFVDLEHAVKDNYAMRIGVDFRPPEMGGTGQAIRLQPRSAEETESLVQTAALHGVDLIVIDSVAGLVSGREVARNVNDPKQKLGVAEIPRFMSNWMPKLQAVIARTKTIVIFINQTRDKIGAMGFTEEALKSTTGGNALKFWAACRFMLKPKMSQKAKRWNPVIKAFEEVQISNDVEVKVIKNKIDAKMGHSGLISIRYGVGVDELRTLMNVATAYGIVKASKNAKKQEILSFKHAGGTIEELGMEKFRLSLSRNQEALAEFNRLSIDRIVEGFRMIDEEELASLGETSISSKNDDDDYEASDAPEEEFVTDDGKAEDEVDSSDVADLGDDAHHGVSSDDISID